METIKLNGTEQQIKWATAIKAEKMPDIEAVEAQLKTFIAENPEDKELRAECTPIFEIIDAMKTAEDATFWIDSREYNFGAMENYCNGYLFEKMYKAGHIK